MRKNKSMIFWFCLPAVLSLLIMFVYPVCRTVLMSFFQVESLTAGVADWSFFGLGNYKKIFSSQSFLVSMQNMLVIWIVGGVFTLLLAMLMAVTVTSGIRGKKFFRAAIYMPNIISAVALATMWIQYIFNYDFGLLNELVKLFGGDKIKWLGSDMKFWAMTASFIFGSVGYYMLIYISGIEGIPQDLYEAATLDGAGKGKQFFSITLPLLKGVIKTSITFWSINTTTFFLWTKMFSPIDTEQSTIVPVVYLYDMVFGGKGVVTRDAGAGAAVGVVLTLIIIAVYLITNRLFRGTDLEY
ncbi:MAG: sugar ABC transporter permease [Oscillospiraceae bacterium]|jgi:ABC-type sugar transport system permease subunit|nr:sugar ABC transporter permease [Oscillospiraceae bacterium]MCI8721145.1 sugar ABC transporter permease [Oscillospiraceae bacterium]MCI8941860.1 sugar ABC transporter permease [Oscillospiraceae bacterium]